MFRTQNVSISPNHMLLSSISEENHFVINHVYKAFIIGYSAIAMIMD